MLSTRHRQLVKRLVRKGALQYKFARTVLKAVNAEHDVGLVDFFRDTRIIPDAFKINVDTRTITAYEVELSSPVQEEKLDRYVGWWWALDDVEWELQLTVFRFLGDVEIPQEIDLGALRIACLKQGKRLNATSC